MKFSNHIFSQIMCIIVIMSLTTACTTTRADLSSNLLDERQIFFRLVNSTGYDIDSATIGHQYVAPNSYARTTYHTNYGALRSGEETRYKQVHNVTIGHEILRVEDVGEQIPYITVNLIAQLDPGYLSEVQWIHPYTKKTMAEQGFIEGKYTIELTNPTFRYNGMDVNISKDE